MMDPKRWVNTLPSTIKSESDKQNYNLNSEKWTETIPIPKKNKGISIIIGLSCTSLMLTFRFEYFP